MKKKWTEKKNIVENTKVTTQLEKLNTTGNEIVKEKEKPTDEDVTNKDGKENVGVTSRMGLPSIQIDEDLEDEL